MQVARLAGVQKRMLSLRGSRNKETGEYSLRQIPSEIFPHDTKNLAIRALIHAITEVDPRVLEKIEAKQQEEYAA